MGETVGFTAFEALSCGTPMLAARAQGFAEHLSHGVNSGLFTPLDTESFDKELRQMMATERKGSWSPEALRASIADASVETCTERILRCYPASRTRRSVAAWPFLTMVMFLAQWFVLCVV